MKKKWQRGLGVEEVMQIARICGGMTMSGTMMALWVQEEILSPLLCL